MWNQTYFSFERNNYYYGKLLTSKDFQNEQGYMNEKRNLINLSLHGVGIVKGLDVVAADDVSIILQTGVAIDASGREIIVPETQVIKLATIEGFEKLHSSCAYLGIAYDELPVDPVYSVMGVEGSDGDNRHFNRVKEGYRLFLLDEDDCIPVEKKENLYLSSTVIYKDSDLFIKQTIPAYATKGKNVKVKVEIEKLSHAPIVFSAAYQIVADGFVNNLVQVSVDNLTQQYGEVTTLEYELVPEDYIFGNNDITMLMKAIEVQKAGNKEIVKEEKKVVITPILEDILTYVLKNSYKGTMNAHIENKSDEKIWISKINLLKSNNAALIDCVEAAPFEQYVYNSEQLMILNKLDEYLVNPKSTDSVEKEPSIIRRDENGNRTNAVRTMASGVFEMSLGNGGEIGKPIFSEEVMHGLGSGAVYVEIGVEYLNKNAKNNTDREEIILGDNSIFAAEDQSEDKVYQIDTAVKILPDRGTFVVGVRPKVKTGKISLRIRWYAMKPEDLEKKVSKIKKQQGCIMMQPDTIVLTPKGTAHINPVFINMSEEPLTYTLLDPEGGKIENNGVYTAPAQEGVYEVKATCVGNPEIYAHAFMIVSQKKSEEE